MAQDLPQPSSSEKKALPKLVVVDGHALFYRSFYAIRALSAPDGLPTNAIFGFIKSLTKVIETLKPQFLVVCFDSAGETFRKTEYADYKAQRKPTPEELIVQFEPLVEVLNAMRVPVLALEGYEADDLIASIVERCSDNDVEAVIVSRDKDLFQLLSDTVSMYDDSKDFFFTPETLLKEKGLSPEQIPDWLGLMGDSSDNIPGVPGVGDRTALALLQQYGTLENTLRSANEIAVKKPKIGKSLVEFAEQARQSKALATIVPETGIEFELENLQSTEPDYAALVEIYRRLGFSSMLKSVESNLPSFPTGTDWRLITSGQELVAAVEEAKKHSIVSIDTETTSFSFVSGRLLGISFSFNEGVGYYIPIYEGYTDEQLALLDSVPMKLEDVREILNPLLANSSIAKVGHNLRFDLNFLISNGFSIEGELFDTLIACWLLAPEGRSLKLDDVVRDYLSLSMIPITDLIGKGKVQKTLADVPLDKVAEYAAEDADAALRLWNAVSTRLTEQGLMRPFVELEMPLVPVIAEMERNGILLDKARLVEIDKDVRREIESLINEIYSIAGFEFNINSTIQLGKLLYDKFDLPEQKKGKVSRSTDAKVLERLKGKHPIIEKVLRYRTLNKLKSTYLDVLPEFVEPKTGAIHSSFNQTGTATGRLSSNRPNLQNIPARSDESKEVRSAFVPRQGCSFVSADYSQIELRILAHFCADPGLVEAFRQDKDIHTAVARELFSVDENEITTTMRATAKAVNFGLIYGQGVFGLANFLSISRTEAKEFIERYFERFPAVRRFREEQIAIAKQKGYVETLYGRRRFMPQLASRLQSERAQGERVCINTLIQGSAADLIKIAMIRIAQKVKSQQLGYRLLLQIHDELLFEVPSGSENAASEMIEFEMTHAVELNVPLKVSIGRGGDWLELK